MEECIDLVWTKFENDKNKSYWYALLFSLCSRDFL